MVGQKLHWALAELAYRKAEEYTKVDGGRTYYYTPPFPLHLSISPFGPVNRALLLPLPASFFRKFA